MKSVRGFPIFLAATAMAMPALPPLLPTNSLAPLLTASWMLRVFYLGEEQIF